MAIWGWYTPKFHIVPKNDTWKTSCSFLEINLSGAVFYFKMFVVYFLRRHLLWLAISVLEEGLYRTPKLQTPPTNITKAENTEHPKPKHSFEAMEYVFERAKVGILQREILCRDLFGWLLPLRIIISYLFVNGNPSVSDTNSLKPMKTIESSTYLTYLHGW